MKVAVNVLNQSPGYATGLLSLFVQLARNLPRHDPSTQYLFASSWQDVEYYASKNPLIRVVGSGWSNRHRLLRVLSEHFLLGRTLSKEGVDVALHCGGGVAPLYLPKKIKLILAVWGIQHMGQAEISLPVRLYRRLLFRRSLSRANVILVNSDYTRKMLEDNVGPLTSPIEVIHHGVDLSLFQTGPLPEEATARLRDKGISGPFVLYVGQVYPYKLLHVLAESYCRLIKRTNLPHKLVVVGSFAKMHGSGSAYHDQILKIFSDHGLSDRAVFVEDISVTDLRYLYAGADLYVQPSAHETFGRTVIEAMACGCPVLAADAAATPEILGTAGRYYSMLDVDGCEKQMEEILTQPEVRASLSKQGLERVQNFSFEKELKALVGLFHRVGADH